LQGLHRIFETQAEIRPDAVAVESGRHSITYRRLDARANQIARYLRARGVERGSIVATALARSIDAYASILGILKAGAAYLPVDPAYPAERIAWMIENSGACALITESDLSGVGAESSEPLAVGDNGATPTDLCYVIYTSGSSGRPKGVMVEHSNACHLVNAERNLFKIQPCDRVWQGAPLSFDLSVEEMWLALAAGATLVAASPETACSSPDLTGITVLSCVPTLLSMLDDSAELPSLRLLILGGETCPSELVARWARPGRRIVNTYGPTETTVIATWADLSPGKPVTIGRALPGYKVFILEGEICIAGEGVARGYIGLEAETQARFVPGRDGARMYRTGDLGRINREGNIEFAGRIDSQVKLRGLRIELAEIESALLRDENIRAAACVVSETQLAAYVVLRNRERWDEQSVRSALRRWLAAWMVPTQIRPVEDLPRLASGKLDRASLKLIQPASRKHSSEPPTSDTERRLMKVWSDLFCSEHISVSDDFFLDLGGYSLLAAQMVSELRKDARFANVTVRDVYSCPTISRLASEVDTRTPTPVDSPTPPPRDKHERIRHFAAGAVQTAALYPIFVFRALLWVAPWLVYFRDSALHAFATAVAATPLMIVFAVCAKWCLLGRIRAGRHRLWGGYYLRWWFVQTLVRSLPLKRLGGTPLLPFVYRLFGARIGKDVHLASDLIAAFDLISIGDGSTVDEGASLLGYNVEDGHLVIGPIEIGRDCLVATRSVVCPGTVMKDRARLEDLSLLPPGAEISGTRVNAGSLRHEPKILLYIVLVLLFPLFELSAFVPGVALLERFNLAAAPIAGASFILCMAAQVVLMKWLLIGRARAGTYPVHGWFYVRHWIVEQLLALSVEVAGPLHSTIFLKPWYRALGAKLGRFVELSNVTTSSPDLLDIGDDCTIADEVSLGAARIERGWLTLAPTKLGRRVFVGNSAVIPAGTTIGDGSLIGVLTLAPEDKRFAARTNASWLGSPPLFLARRQPASGFSEESTFRPTRKLQFARGCWELFRISLPGAGFVIATVGVIDIAPAVPIFALPAVYAALCAAIMLAVVSMKWLVAGRYRPFQQPCWSAAVWRLELVNALFEFLAVPIGLETLQGTPLLPWFLRLLGCRIGKGAYVDTTGFLEFDLVNIGDRAILNHDCILQTHLFEDRVMKASHLKIGTDCEVGTQSIVLYDTELQDGARLGPLSLVMKGETLPAGQVWVGSPLGNSRAQANHERLEYRPVVRPRAAQIAVGFEDQL